MTENMIEIYLPDNNIIKTFNNKSLKEKVQIIELGLKMYQTGNLQLNNINDEKRKKDVNDLIQSYEGKINEMRQNISNHKKIQQEL